MKTWETSIERESVEILKYKERLKSWLKWGACSILVFGHFGLSVFHLSTRTRFDFDMRFLRAKLLFKRRFQCAISANDRPCLCRTYECDHSSSLSSKSLIPYSSLFVFSTLFAFTFFISPNKQTSTTCFVSLRSSCALRYCYSFSVRLH